MVDTYTDLLSKLFDEKIVSVLSVLLLKTGEFGVREIAREASVSTATTYRIILKLGELGVVSKTKRGKNFSYFVVPSAEEFGRIHNLIIGPRPTPSDVLRRELDTKVGASNYRLLVRGSGKAEKVFVVCDTLVDTMHGEIGKTILDDTGQKLSFTIISTNQLSQMQEMGLL